ncbi:hypothetical protein Taro_051059 [Colocasia esculenta]|uniref:Uncharacterized protein n=1 Tax=Colocasia esculenta TaxID=4460 RepID=A0A843XFU3_COLES|nr:hypothetical protein [Colocasia esculenta]
MLRLVLVSGWDKFGPPAKQSRKLYLTGERAAAAISDDVGFGARVLTWFWRVGAAWSKLGKLGNGVLSWFLCENRSAGFLSEKATIGLSRSSRNIRPLFVVVYVLAEFGGLAPIPECLSNRGAQAGVPKGVRHGPAAVWSADVVLVGLHCSLALLCGCGAIVGPFVRDCETESCVEVLWWYLVVVGAEVELCSVEVVLKLCSTGERAAAAISGNVGFGARKLGKLGNGVLSWFLCDNWSAGFLSEKAMDRAIAFSIEADLYHQQLICGCVSVSFAPSGYALASNSTRTAASKTPPHIKEKKSEWCWSRLLPAYVPNSRNMPEVESRSHSPSEQQQQQHRLMDPWLCVAEEHGDANLHKIEPDLLLPLHAYPIHGYAYLCQQRSMVMQIFIR